MSEQKLIWNVFYEDFNAREIKSFNVFDHCSFYGNVKRLLKECQNINDFNEQLRRETKYYFWCKAEYEVVITSWPVYIDAKEFNRIKNIEKVKYREWIEPDIGIKVDIFSQLDLNWEKFVDYIWFNKNCD